jgi:excisionase family DNA binding protein
MFENYDEILTPSQLVDLLGVNKNIIYKLLNSGEIQSFKIGKQHRVTHQSLEEYIINQQNSKTKRET